MSSVISTRPYQIVVWGATGFTGRLVCEHIAKDYQGRIKWALAGRDKRKLESVRQQLVEYNPDCKDVPIIIADAQQQTSLKSMLEQTDVVVATAGPFSLYGSNLVAASVEAGTHYCDITGEVPWVKTMRAKHHEEAAAKKVRIVHCCGYDSIPSDLGTLLVVDFMREQLGRPCSQVISSILPGQAGVSGGTIASGKHMADTLGPEETERWQTDQYYLVDDPMKKGSDTPAPKSTTYSALAGAYMCPFVMEAINARIVQLSNSLQPVPYGSDFRYWEGLAFTNVVTAWLMTLMARIIDKVFSVKPLWAVASRFLPKPGEGPTREAMMNGGNWHHDFVGVTEEEGGKAPQVVRATLKDPKRDPGYWGTSRMILEAALCLALQKAELDATGKPAGGVLTPAVAMGMILVERLRAAGLIFEITSPTPSKTDSQPAGMAAAAAAAQ